MRAMRQRDSYGCGPVALYNALSLNGVKADLKGLYDDCIELTDTKVGKTTYRRDFLKAAKKSGLVLKKINPHKISDDGQYLVFMTKIHRNIVYGHYVFVKNGIVFNLSRQKRDKMPLRMRLSNWKVRAILLFSPPQGRVEVWKIKRVHRRANAKAQR